MREMDKQQYDRWKDFSLRMAKTCFRNSRRPTSIWIVEQVESWFSWRDYQEDWNEYNSWDQDRWPLCDAIREFYEDLEPCVRCKACKHENCRQNYPHYEDSCPICERKCNCDDIEYAAYGQFSDQWLGPIQCCIRAGIDMACEPSAGVVGFTAGDVRRMYPEGVPEWAFPRDKRLQYWLTGELNGTFADLPDDAGVVL